MLAGGALRVRTMRALLPIRPDSPATDGRGHRVESGGRVGRVFRVASRRLDLDHAALIRTACVPRYRSDHCQRRPWQKEHCGADEQDPEPRSHAGMVPIAARRMQGRDVG